MEERLQNLYKKLYSVLNTAPVDEDCTAEELEMYSDMANLLNSMFNAGYGN